MGGSVRAEPRADFFDRGSHVLDSEANVFGIHGNARLYAGVSKTFFVLPAHSHDQFVVPFVQPFDQFLNFLFRVMPHEPPQ